ncbi:hypothetical protein DUI87_13485 [Hirundo rustica rustica]|uniref:Reverse transcriptase domain-containing protein n=1 Tax=Hirundo rustica rustica TaxID=333673 RepID=A0A3M0K963_HIRRU|nr:hypothetical protein DUI87_13485 [Hirundo rustica rustica]
MASLRTGPPTYSLRSTLFKPLRVQRVLRLLHYHTVITLWVTNMQELRTSERQNRQVVLRTTGRDMEKNRPPVIQEEAVCDRLSHLDAHKSMGPSGIHLSDEGADGRARQAALHHLSSILANWEVPDDWKLTNVTPIHKKGWKEDPGKYRPDSLTLVPSKVMEQIVLSAITQHLQDNWGIRPSQHGFRRGRSCLTNRVSFYDHVTRLVDAGKAVYVVHLDFSKAF